MSHFTRVRTRLTDHDVLVQALRNLGYAVERRASVRGWRGQTLAADIVVRGTNGYDIGFVATQNGFEAVADWSGISEEQEVFIGRIRQEYALLKAESAARRAGWVNLRRIRQDDGAVVLAGDPGPALLARLQR